MSLLKEASADDAFNRHMSKIQDAIQAIEKLTIDQPVGSQVMALQVAAEDLDKLAKEYKKKRGK